MAVYVHQSAELAAPSTEPHHATVRADGKQRDHKVTARRPSEFDSEVVAAVNDDRQFDSTGRPGSATQFRTVSRPLALNGVFRCVDEPQDVDPFVQRKLGPTPEGFSEATPIGAICGEVDSATGKSAEARPETIRNRTE